MTRRHLIALPLLLLCFTSVRAQGKLAHLKSWDGKGPEIVNDKGKVINFFALPEIRTPLKRLLKPVDFNLLSKVYVLGSDLKLMGDFLAVVRCHPHNCNDGGAGFAVNLRTGDMYVRMTKGQLNTWTVSRGKASDLPKEVWDFLAW